MEVKPPDLACSSDIRQVRATEYGTRRVNDLIVKTIIVVTAAPSLAAEIPTPLGRAPLIAIRSALCRHTLNLDRRHSDGIRFKSHQRRKPPLLSQKWRSDCDLKYWGLNPLWTTPTSSSCDGMDTARGRLSMQRRYDERMSTPSREQTLITVLETMTTSTG